MKKQPTVFRGDRLRDLRKEAGFATQTALATDLGIDQQHISVWESGASDPSAANLMMLARYFTMKLGRPVTLEYLVGMAEPVASRARKLTPEELEQGVNTLIREGKIIISLQTGTSRTNGEDESSASSK